MDEKLKQFIQDNGDAFNSEEPGSHVFRRIQEQLPGYKKKSSWLSFRMAAAVAGLLLASAAVYLFVVKKNKTGNEVVIEQPLNKTDDLSEIGDPVYAKQIYHFKELIGLKQNELKQLQKEYPQLYEEFMGDIDQLDSSYQALKTRLGENPNREMLLEAMLQNLQLQTDLLNRQLLIIKEIKQKKYSHEKSTI